MTRLRSGHEQVSSGRGDHTMNPSNYADCEKKPERMIADPKGYFEEATRRAIDREPEARHLPLTILAVAFTGGAFLPIIAPEVLPLGYLFLISAAALALYAGRRR